MLVLAIHFVSQSILNFSKDVPVLFHSSLQCSFERLANELFLFIGHSCLSVFFNRPSLDPPQGPCTCYYLCDLLLLCLAHMSHLQRGLCRLSQLRSPWPPFSITLTCVISFRGYTPELRIVFVYVITVSLCWNLNSSRAVFLLYIVYQAPSPVLCTQQMLNSC